MRLSRNVVKTDTIRVENRLIQNKINCLIVKEWKLITFTKYYIENFEDFT